MAPELQDKPTEDHYRALLAREGWPIIKGSSPEGEEETEGGDGTEVPGNGQGQGAEEESFIDSSDLNEIPEELRPQMEALQKEWQGKYTQKRQADKQEIEEARREAQQGKQLQEALQNPQVAPAVLAQLGYSEKQILEMYGYQPEEEEELGFDDPDERISRLEQTLAQRDQAEQSARFEEEVTDTIAGQIEQLEQKEDREFDPEEHQLLDTYARAYAKNGVPDVEGAYKLLSGIVDSRQKQWIESKKTPRPAGGGKAGSRTVDLSKETPEERKERMATAVSEASGV